MNEGAWITQWTIDKITFAIEGKERPKKILRISIILKKNLKKNPE